MTSFFHQLFKTQNEEEKLLLHRHQVLVENLAAALVIRDNNGQITYCSPFTEVLTGYPLQSIYESETEDFFLSQVHPADKESYLRSIALAKLGESFEMRHRFFHHSGFEMWIESRTSPLHDETGAIIASLSIMLDMTRAVRFEEQLQEKTFDLQQITAVAAEEIQNEVFTMKGMLSLLDDGISIEEMKEAVGMSATKLHRLASGLTEFGKASSGKRELRALSVQRVLSHFTEEQTTLGVQVELLNAPESRIVADEEELQLVFSALSDYMTSLCQTDAAPRLQLSLAHTNTETEILMEDYGPPIPEHLAKSLFRPSTEGAPIISSLVTGKRTPFSLSLTQKRMQQIGGGLDFQVTDRGTNCFILTLRSAPSLAEAVDTARQ